MGINEVDFRDAGSVMRLLTGACSVFLCTAPMEMPPELPVDPVRILRAYVYPQPDCQHVFEQALCRMGNGSVDQVYLFFEFVDACLFCELDQKCASFRIDRQLLLPLLKKQISRYEKELRGTVRFSNGYARTNVMKHIEEAAQWYQDHYGFDMFEAD